VIAANANPYPPGGGTLVLSDPLADDSQGHGWDVGSTADGMCAFGGGAYHVSSTKTQHYHFCAPSIPDVSNFAFEAQVTLLKGDCGGLIFRRTDNTGDQLYLFEVCQDGSYSLYLYTTSNSNVLASGSPTAIMRGLNQSNVLAVVALGNMLVLYVNKQRITSVSDSTYSHGQIALAADAFNNSPTEVAFSNARLWTL